MATTRDFKSLGVWAEDANIVIPPSPIPGVAYRDETVTESQNEAGEAFAIDPDSATFNQRLFIVSSFTGLMDTHGIVGWSDQVDYDIPAMVFADDGKFYFALQASGPSTTPQDPTGAPTFWEEFVTQQLLAEESGASLIGTIQGTAWHLNVFVPTAWAAVVRPDGLISNGTNRGFAEPVSHPSAGLYIFTLNTPTIGNVNDRMVLLTPFTNIGGGDDSVGVGHKLLDDTLSTIVVETFNSSGMLADPETESGFSIIVQHLQV